MDELHRTERAVLPEGQGLIPDGRLAAASRYSRQIRCAPFGAEGQARLRSASVLIVGVGALGSHAAESLARAGVGHLWLVDRDVVELHNLQRQVLFTEEDAHAGRPKAIAAAAALARINSEVRIDALPEDFRPELYAGLGKTPDLILDGTDNFPTRYLINDLSARDRLPWIYAGVLGTRGMAMVVQPGKSPCLRCLMPDAGGAGGGESCETAGVLGPAVATVSAFQCAEALKLLSGNTAAVTRGLLEFDVWSHAHALRMTGAGPAAHCPCCAEGRFPALAEDWSPPLRLCGREAVQVHPHRPASVDLGELERRIAKAVTDIERTPHLLRFSADGCRFSVFPGGRTLVFGTADPARARSLFDRYVGS